MLAVMEASQSAAGPSNSTSNNSPSSPDSTTNVEEFLATGRTGRRNALPDILDKESVQKLQMLADMYDTEKSAENSDADHKSDSDSSLEDSCSSDDADNNSCTSLEERHVDKNLEESDEGKKVKKKRKRKKKKTSTESQHAVVTSSDLSTRLQGLTTSDKPPQDPHDQPGCSKS